MLKQGWSPDAFCSTDSTFVEGLRPHSGWKARSPKADAEGEQNWWCLSEGVADTLFPIERHRVEYPRHSGRLTQSS